MRTKDPIDLAQLADTYDVLGELAGRDDAQLMLATRKSDNRPVLIVVQREPAGDEGNALSHMASDAGLLADASHPSVVRVLDSRWLGNEALALVVDRPNAPSLEERLSRREEEFSFPRIATVLRDVNAALEWARDRRVVNRAIRLDSVFLEEGSDAVKVLFTASPLPLNGIPDADSDARAVATLARAMMTRSVADPERDQLPLAELRPGLPSRVVQQTEALMGRADSIEPVDIRAYISAIAMAEELKSGEDECVRVTREMGDEQRAMREQLAAERKAHEEDLAEQAKRFEKEREDILREMAREREETAKAAARERADGEKALRLERERIEKQLREERQALEQERQRLEKETLQARERFEREMQKQRAQLAKEQSRIERERQALEKDRVALARLRETAVAVPLTVEPYDEIVEESEPAAAESTEDIPETAEYAAETTDVVPVEESEDRLPVLPPIPTLDMTPRSRAALPKSNRSAPGFLERVLADPRWRMGGVAALVLLLVVAAAAVAAARRSSEPGMPQSVQLAPTAPLTVVDSLAGVTVPPDSAAIAASATEEAGAAERARRDERSAPARRPRREFVPVVPDPYSPPPVDTPSVPRMESTLTADTTRAVPVARDTMRPAPAVRDTTRVAPVVRDTTVRRDSVVPRSDTTRAEPVRPPAGVAQ